jgi:uncharacterized membrane protein YgcG
MSIFSSSTKAEVGDIINLQRQDVEVEECEKCGHLMVNIDEDELRQGDLIILKRKGVRISNPNTEDLICVDCEFTEPESFGSKVSSWFDDDDDDDDSGFFGGGSSSSFGGGFGGFGGGGFSGGGAGRSF